MRKKMCYFGLLVSAVLVIILFAVPMAKGVSAGLSILFACLFSVSYVQLSYECWMKGTFFSGKRQVILPTAL